MGAQLSPTKVNTFNMAESNKTSTDVPNSIDYTTTTPRFSVKDDQALQAGLAYLDEHGYAVISDVLDANEIDFNKNLLWKFLENYPNSKVRRDDPETWANDW